MKILIVEDEPGIYNFLRQGFKEEGYVVEVATNGPDGLAQALKGYPDLLVLDWMLPGLNGIEVCRQLRIQRPHTPIIFLTAKDTVAETIEGLKSGANDYVKKPFHFAELLERVKVQLRSVKRETQTYCLGSICLNSDTHQVFNGREEIRLTQKEFALLEYLLTHKGKVCTRTQIIKDVWDIHFEYNTGVIDVYMNALRKKLKLDEAPTIQTIRGVGYKATEG